MSNEVIYNIIKKKDYTISPYLFKIIKENNLDINETLLLIYLTNQEHPELDLKVINDITSLNNEEILSAFSSLTSKNLISTSISKDGERVIEEISLDSIYKLAASNINKNVTKEIEQNIFELFESEFARPLSPMEFEFINAWISSGMNEDLIKEKELEMAQSNMGLAINKIKEILSDAFREYDDVISTEVLSYMQKLDKLKEKQLEYNQISLFETEGLSRTKQLKKNNIESTFNEYYKWYKDSLEAEDKPFIKIIAVLMEV